uniref:uncharacterized protein LOC123999040 n=1 Tax=Oncorhynchus gorbuscha TaxID=8017 RepID=UPI001EAEDD86|nr:uncharacterized protein LOC123999040 [Oncorhynchus gorbuscha]
MSNLSPDNLKAEQSSAAPPSLIIVDGLEGYLHGPGVSGGLQQAEQSSAAPPSLIIVDGLEGYLCGPGVSGGLQQAEQSSAAPPSLIIVDGLEGYLRGPGVSGGLQQAEQSSAAHISALLYDTAAFLTQTLEERAASLAPCRVIASFQSEWEGHAGGDSSDPVLSVLDRYFQVRCTLDQDWNSAPAVAGPQDTWHVYLSGAGITEDPIAKDEEDSSLAGEWRLVICPNRSMEFTMV